MLSGIFKRSCYLFAYNTAHARHHKIGIHNADDRTVASYSAFARHYCVLQSRAFLHTLYLLLIVGEADRIQ